MFQEDIINLAAICEAQDLQKVDCPWKTGQQPKQGTAALSGKRFHSYTGRGTANDPLVAWLGNINDMSLEMIEAHEHLCRKIARRAGQKFCVIRGAVHNTFFNKLANKTTAADDHITVYLGMNEYDLRLQGHIYVRTNEQGHPVDTKHPWQLKYVPEGREPRTVELYGVNGSLGYMYDVKPDARKSYQSGLKPLPNSKQHVPHLEYVEASATSRMKPLTPPKDKPLVFKGPGKAARHSNRTNRFTPMGRISERPESQRVGQRQIRPPTPEEGMERRKDFFAGFEVGDGSMTLPLTPPMTPPKNKAVTVPILEYAYI